MKKLLTAPVTMNLSDNQNQQYQQVLKYVAELSLNFMAVKVENRPDNFLTWCQELHRICQEDLNIELLDAHQFKPLKKLEETLIQTISVNQLKIARVMPWPIFTGYIEDNAERQALDQRLALLSYIKGLLNQPFDQWIEEDKLAFIGKHTAKHDPSVYKFDVEYFGSNKNAKAFLALVNQQPEQITELINLIPLTGEINYSHYQAFVAKYQALFAQYLPEEKVPFSPATRLLAMIRPDQFIGLTKAKADTLCLGFDIAKLNTNAFEDYWYEVIATIRVSAWWQATINDEVSEQEQLIWQNRVALLDNFFYVDSNFASQSNYIRLRDKPKKATSKSLTSGMKRTKASAQQLVDQALADESIPEFIKGMRDSIVKSVESGKSVTEAINLMRAIFG